MHKHKKLAAVAAVVTGIIGVGLVLAQPAPGPMSFFLASRGSGNGGNLGRARGADRICQDLAQAAGHGALMWRAYLSTRGRTPSTRGTGSVPGRGSMCGARGSRPNVEELHSPANRMAVFTALDERGNQIPGSGFSPNRHDILTGSQPDGRAYPAGADMTCSNWTSSSDEGGAKARVGHHDYSAWNSTHDSRGCSQAGLVSTGGDGLFYCFALPAQ